MPCAPDGVEVLVNDERLDRAHLETLQSVLHAKAELAAVKRKLAAAEASKAQAEAVATATAAGHNANTFWQHPHQNNSGRTNLPNIFHQAGRWHANGWAQCLKLSRVRWRCLALTPHGPSKPNTNVPGRSSGTLVTGRAE